MVVIVDYKVGNIKNVINSFIKLGFDPVVTSDPNTIIKADVVILPGVGAFNDAMRSLRETGIDKAIKYRAENNLTVIGICLGMQVLFDKSYEDGEFEGLGIFKGVFKRFQFDDPLIKVPHMGWNNLFIRRNDPIVSGISETDYVYFVHSYYLCDFDNDDLVAYADYNVTVPAIVRKGNIIGMQFHPEKSSTVGEALLRNFKSIIENVL